MAHVVKEASSSACPQTTLRAFASTFGRGALRAFSIAIPTSASVGEKSMLWKSTRGYALVIEYTNLPSGSAVDMSEQLYGTRPSVRHRWPSAKTLGDTYRETDASYPSKVVFRKWFDEKGKKLITSKTLRWCSAVIAATKNAFSKKGSTTRVEASPKGNKGQTKMRRSSSVASNWLVLSIWHTKRFCEQQYATRATARVPSEHTSSLAAAVRQDRDRQALQQTSRRHQNNSA